MAWRFTGRARVDPDNPKAFAVCDRCGFWYNHVDLRWQFQWMGPQLQNKRILVCSTCLDEPQENLRTIILPPDPEPVLNARPENRIADFISFLITEGDDFLVTEGDDELVTENSNIGD